MLQGDEIFDKLLSVHDVSDGGIACAATEIALASGNGVIFAPSVNDKLNTTAWLFGEDSGRTLLAVAGDKTAEYVVMAAEAGVDLEIVGQCNKAAAKDLIILGTYGSLRLSDLRSAHEDWLPTYMSKMD